MKKNLKHYLLLIMLTFCLCKTYASADETVTISNDSFRIGSPVNVTVSGTTATDYQYEWLLDDTKLNGFKNKSTPVITGDFYGHWLTINVYSGDVLLGSDKKYVSNLPVLYINTEDEAEIADRTNYVDGTMFAQGNEKYVSQYNGEIKIRGRGATSWYAPKKSYKLKLSKKTNMFGFGKNKHWVLRANYSDPSLIRNNLADILADKLSILKMDNTWVDVVLNGKYIGNYQFLEHIRINKNRVNIFNWEDEAENAAEAICENTSLTKDDCDVLSEQMQEDFSWIDTGTVTYKNVEYTIKDYYDYKKDYKGGYLFELSKYIYKMNGVIVDDGLSYSSFNTKQKMTVEVKQPEYAFTSANAQKYIKTLFNDFDNAYHSIDGYNSKGKHYSTYADVDSMAGYAIIMYVLGNVDASVRSRFAYIDHDGIIKFGPVWDFDFSCKYPVSWIPTLYSEGGQNFFTHWIDDPYYTTVLAEKYFEMRPALLDIVKDDGYISQYVDYIKYSAYANERCWSTDGSFDTEIKTLKACLIQRLEWLDKQFTNSDTLTTSIYNESPVSSTSYYPYLKSNEVSFTSDDLISDNESAYFPADGLMTPSCNNPVINIKIDSDVYSIQTYVNGLKFKRFNTLKIKYTYPAKDSTTTTSSAVSIQLTPEKLKESADRLNVITVIAYNKSNKPIYRSHYILKKSRYFSDVTESTSAPSQSPVSTSTSGATVVPVSTSAADTTTTPVSTSAADATATPVSTSTTDVTATPVSTSAADATATPDSTSTADATATPVSTGSDVSEGNANLKPVPDSAKPQAPAQGPDSTLVQTPAQGPDSTPVSFFEGQVLPDINNNNYYIIKKIKTCDSGIKIKSVIFYKPIIDIYKIKIPKKIEIFGYSGKIKVVGINKKTFYKNETITTLEIGNNVKKIKEKSFYKCKNLKEVHMGKNVKKIGKKAFYKCKNLEKVTLNKKLKHIGEKAFSKCKKLKGFKGEY